MKEELMKLRGQYVTAKLEYETLAAEIQANAQAVKSAVDTFTHYGSMPMRDPLVRQLANTAAQLDRLKACAAQADALREEMQRLQPMTGL